MIKTAKQLPLVRSGITWLRSLARRSYHAATIRLYALELNHRATSDPLPTTRDSWSVANNQPDHLKNYDPSTGWQCSTAFQQSAAERLARGETLFSICVDQTLAHYGWLIFPTRLITIPEVEQCYELPECSAYLYDFFTHPAFRNRGMYQASMQRILADLQERGCASAYIGVAPGNVPSCRAIEKLGFQPVATLGYRRIATNVRRWIENHDSALHRDLQ